jgi:hypothetical protein
MLQSEMIPPDPNLLISQMVPVMGILSGILISGFVVLGPVGRAIGDVVRHLFGAGGKKTALPPEELDAMHARFDAIQHQLTEIAERQDFAERMLAQTRERGALPAGGREGGHG